MADRHKYHAMGVRLPDAMFDEVQQAALHHGLSANWLLIHAIAKGWPLVQKWLAEVDISAHE